ncbi:MAG: hypothetical protein GEU97_07010 [Actinophytocola sp.]|nr:hypothetical protein [Actinophytocola sp.]
MTILQLSARWGSFLAAAAALVSLMGCDNLSTVTGLKVGMEDNFGREYAITSEEAAVIRDLSIAGFPENGYMHISEILRVAHALCDGPEAVDKQAGTIAELKFAGMTEEHLVALANATDAYLC